MKKKIYIFVCSFFLILDTFAQGQFLNKVFEGNTGNPQFNQLLTPFGLEWGTSIACATGGVLSVGHTSVSGQGEDVLLTKYDNDGNILFQSTFNTNSTYNDFGLGISETPSGDILVCGTTDNGGTTDYDAVILKFNSMGTLQNSVVYGSLNNLVDFAVSVTEDAAGNILIAGNTQGTSGLFDYWVVKFNSTLAFVAENSYDYTGLQDIALGIEIVNGGTEINLIGASSSGTSSCDYAVAVFNATNLSFTAAHRNNIPGTALDQALAFCKDNSNNIYITGKAWNGTNFDIKTIKISATYSIAWTSTINVHGADDAASAIVFNPLGNEVYIVGYTTKMNNVKSIYFSKLNAGTGLQLGELEMGGENSAFDAYAKNIQVNQFGDVYYFGGEVNKYGLKQGVVGKVKGGNTLAWQRKIGSASADIVPSDLLVNSEGVYAISVIDATSNSYQTNLFTELELDTSKQYYGTTPYKEHELIVRFQPSVINQSMINNHNIAFGDLKDFISIGAYNQIIDAMKESRICEFDCKLQAIKIFPGISTTDSLQRSNLNEIVAVPEFWSALNLKLPNSISVTQLASMLNTLPNVAAYAEPNFLATLYGFPNDSLYFDQHSLVGTLQYPNSNVNVSEAWEVIPSGGKEFIRCSVFDSPVDWENRDFNYDGINQNSSKIKEGWDFYTETSILTQVHGGAYGNFHGSAVTGIIGAQRNNVCGIAGIAGGNDSTGHKGISLYNDVLFYGSGTPFTPLNAAPATYIANAIYVACLSPNQAATPQQPLINNYAYDVQLQNHSWGLESPSIDPGFQVQTITLIKEAMRAISRLKVTAVAARGNFGTSNKTFPANSDDDWVITVSGAGVDGNFAHNTNGFIGPYNCEFTSAWGGGIDVSAPCSGSVIVSLYTPNPSSTVSPQPVCGGFGGTSAAAPHVT